MIIQMINIIKKVIKKMIEIQMIDLHNLLR